MRGLTCCAAAPARRIPPLAAACRCQISVPAGWRPCEPVARLDSERPGRCARPRCAAAAGTAAACTAAMLRLAGASREAGGHSSAPSSQAGLAARRQRACSCQCRCTRQCACSEAVEAAHGGKGRLVGTPPPTLRCPLCQPVPALPATVPARMQRLRLSLRVPGRCHSSSAQFLNLDQPVLMDESSGEHCRTRLTAAGCRLVGSGGRCEERVQVRGLGGSRRGSGCSARNEEESSAGTGRGGLTAAAACPGRSRRSRRRCPAGRPSRRIRRLPPPPPPHS